VLRAAELCAARFRGSYTARRPFGEKRPKREDSIALNGPLPKSNCLLPNWCYNSTMARRAKQTDFVALNVRLPPELHKKLASATGSTRSLNSEIVERLQHSFGAIYTTSYDAMIRSFEKMTPGQRKIIHILTSDISDQQNARLETWIQSQDRRLEAFIEQHDKALEEFNKRFDVLEERLSREK
jgi:hypothetical protein